MNFSLKNKIWPCLQMGRYAFTPNVLATCLVVILLPLFIKLGCWQWSRAQENQQLINNFIARSQTAVIPLQQVTTPIAPWINTPVVITGHYLALKPFFLDNVVVQHRIGYRVLSVFQPVGLAPAVLVDRGFVPAPRARTQLPRVETPTAQQTLQGFVTQPYQSALILKTHAKLTLADRQRLATVNISQLAQTMGQPLAPFVVTLRESDVAGGLAQSLQPPNKVNMHKGYAFQWFTFAFVLLLLYIFVNLRRTNKTLNER